MTDCFQPWRDNMGLCWKAMDGVTVPVDQTPENAPTRTIVCSKPECQALIKVFHDLVETNCSDAMAEASKFPYGLCSPSFCPPTNTTTALTPIIAMAAVPTPLAPVATPPDSASDSDDDDDSTTIIVVGCGGLVIALLSIIIVILCMRRKRNDKSADPASLQENEEFAYANLSTARTDDDTLTETDLLHGGLALAAVRIPYKNLRFGSVLSQGGFGEVTRGLYNDKLVVVKRLLASRRKDPHSIRSFFKEIQLTSTLDHECIVRFLGVSWDIPANLCMVSEFMVGGDLRDLKSRNILLSSKGDAKLIDFGISCERQDVTMTAGVGTSLWMAPEVMLGRRYDEKADVFSFGVILSELDTHELPYDHARDTVSGQKISNMVLMQLISEGKLKPRFTPMADPEMVALAEECLEVDPTKRPLASQVLYQIDLSRRNDRQVAGRHARRSTATHGR